MKIPVSMSFDRETGKELSRVEAEIDPDAFVAALLSALGEKVGVLGD